MSRKPSYEKQMILNFESSSIYRPEDFFQGSSNQAAFRALMSWPHWSSYALILQGPGGSGKTHLATLWQKITKGFFLEALPFSATSTASGSSSSLERSQKTFRMITTLQDMIKNPYAEHLACILEDFPNPFFSEEELFHILNLIREQQGFLLITTQKTPQQWNLSLADLYSRLISLPMYTLENPADDVLCAVLRKHFADFQLVVPENVLSYSLSRLERSFQSARNFARKLNIEALIQKKPVTLSLARHCLNTKD